MASVLLHFPSLLSARVAYNTTGNSYQICVVLLSKINCILGKETHFFPRERMRGIIEKRTSILETY